MPRKHLIALGGALVFAAAGATVAWANRLHGLVDPTDALAEG
jgi:hypothetical protein